MLNDIQIKNRLLLILAFPMLGVLIFSISGIVTKVRQYQNTEINFITNTIAAHLADTVHELQLERGLSSGFLGSSGKQFIEPLKKHRIKTDKQIQQLKNYVDQINISKINQTKYDITNYISSLQQSLSILRDKVNHTGTVNDIFNQYSHFNDTTIKMIQKLKANFDDIGLIQQTNAYSLTLWLIERSGQERGMLNKVFASNILDIPTYHIINGFIAAQKTLLNHLQYTITPSQKVHLEQYRNHPANSLLLHIRKGLNDKINKTELLSHLQSLIGYGGLIHDFKNFIIRDKMNYTENFSKRFALVKQLLNEYQQLPSLNSAEKNNLNIIQTTFEEYRIQIQKIAQMHHQNSNIAAIDNIVYVNDEPALNALNELRNNFNMIESTHWFEIATERMQIFTQFAHLLKNEITERTLYLKQSAIRDLLSYAFSLLTVVSVSLIMGRLLSLRLVEGFTELSHNMNNVKNTGNFKHQVNAHGKDDLGIMMQCFNHLMQSLHEDTHQINQFLKAIAQGNLEHRIHYREPMDTNDEMAQLTEHCNNMANQLEKFHNDLKASNEALIQQRAKAELANKFKSHFLANMSHEIRTPLNAVIGYSQILQEDCVDCGHENYIDDLKRIESQGMHLLQLINDILDLSKIEADKLDIIPETIHMFELIESITSISCPLSRKNNNQMKIENHCEKMTIYSDPIRAKQIIYNLLSNACKFTKNGLIQLVVKKTSEDTGEYIVFKVIDNGIGMTEDEQSHIFHAFSQAEKLTTKKFGGTGLGLTISKKLCEMMGGHISVSSTKDKGTTFTVLLPIVYDQAKQPASP